jgi:hypothetical protein
MGEEGEKRDHALGVVDASANDLAIAAPNARRERRAGEAVEGTFPLRRSEPEGPLSQLR